ncbi:HAMP domain-containing histidine kinase [Intestinibacillus massiliensis]|nr:HAMP domain-containing histidine kinase [Intestinibacillus massiliensis]
MKYRKKQAARGKPAQEVRVQHSPGGLKGRWMINSLSFVVCILAAVIIFVSMGISSYYYSNLRGNLVTRASETAGVFKKYWTNSEEQFISMADQHVADFKEKDKLELQFIDRYGRVFCSSSGLATDSIPGTSDVERAMGDKAISVFTGEDPQTGERVMSVSAPLTTNHGELIGAVRYITSLELAERQIAIVILLSIVASLVFLVLVVASNRYFIKSIVEPVMKINVIAGEIAAGRYGMRLQKVYDDEIGELCDTINYMSDEISRAERMKNDFISSVSHELRTPLTAIAGWSETLIAGGAQDREETMQGLEIIQKESRRLTQMVEELLDFSRIESGRMKLEVGPFDVSIELYEAIYMYENLLEDAGIQVAYHKEEGSYFISGDRHRIKQVFLNVLDNAAKYGKSGGRIEISLRREAGNVVVCVRDWGAGIPEAELPFVKEKFYKGSSKQRGSGIGLAVTDEIVTLHGGALDIRSRVGEGTAVYITLPALEAHTAMGVEGITEPTEETEE